MFEKIAAFFKSIFSGLFGGGSDDKKTTTPGKTTSTTSSNNSDNLPKAEPEFPQDAPEVVNTDTAAAVVVTDETKPVIIEPGDDPAAKPEEDISTEPEVISDPVVTEEKADTDPEPEVEQPPVVDTPDPVEEVPKHKARYMWCLDNGHGKKTAGKRSPKFEDGRQFFEYEFNRDIVKRIIEQLEKIGVKYFNVVPEVDIDNFLEGRVGRANNFKSALPKIFLSVHANAFGRSGWEPPSGIETWFYHNSRSGRAIARIFQKHLIDELGWKNRNLKSYPGPKQFYVLRNTKMPAVLTENGFYTNKKECSLLLKDSVRQQIADAHVAAILEIEKNGFS